MHMPIQLLSEQQMQTIRMQQRASATSSAETDEEVATVGPSTPLLAKRGVCVAMLWARVLGHRHRFRERLRSAVAAATQALSWLRSHAYEPLASCDGGSDDEETVSGSRGFRPATEAEIREKNTSLSVRREHALLHARY